MGRNILKTKIYRKKYPQNQDLQEEISLKPRFTGRHILKTDVYGRTFLKNFSWYLSIPQSPTRVKKKLGKVLFTFPKL